MVSNLIGAAVPSASKFELPFRLGIVRTDDQLSAICQVRCRAYSRHVPEFGATLAKPEALDKTAGVLNFYIQHKLTGQIIATARLQNNFQRALEINADWQLPPWLLEASAAEITRFSVLSEYANSSGLISRVLVKACYHYCFATQIQWVVIGARRSLAKGYIRLGYRDLDPDAKYHRMAHIGNLEHRVLVFDVVGAERSWHELKNPYYDFMHKQYHPDIELFSSLSSIWTRPRSINYIEQNAMDMFPIV